MITWKLNDRSKSCNINYSCCIYSVFIAFGKELLCARMLRSKWSGWSYSGCSYSDWNRSHIHTHIVCVCVLVCMRAGQWESQRESEASVRATCNIYRWQKATAIYVFGILNAVLPYLQWVVLLLLFL